MGELIAAFDSSFSSGDDALLYKTAQQLANIYFKYWSKKYGNFTLDAEEAITDICGKLFILKKTHPDKPAKYFFGCIKSGMRFYFLTQFQYNAKQRMLSDLLDVDEHRYPESMMHSVDELARKDLKYLMQRRVLRILIEFADKLMTPEEISVQVNMNYKEVHYLLNKYDVTYVTKKKKETHERFISYNNGEDTDLPISTFAEKYGMTRACARNYLKMVNHKKDLTKHLHVWDLSFNPYPIKSLQDFVKFTANDFYIEKSIIPSRRNTWQMHEYYINHYVKETESDRVSELVEKKAMLVQRYDMLEKRHRNKFHKTQEMLVLQNRINRIATTLQYIRT